MPATRSRKLRLSPVQGALLRLLEGAGSEEIPVVLNTLQAQFPAYRSEELLHIAEEAIDGLHKVGLVACSRDYGVAGLHYVQIPDQDLKGGRLIRHFSVYDEDRGAWNWGNLSGNSEPISLILTDQRTQALTQ
jgi:hypothetical protein